MAGPPGSIFYSANFSFPEGSADPMAYLRTPVVQAFDWIGLIAIGWCTVTLAVKLVYFKPPPNTEVGRTVLYYFGYNEKGMVSFWVNLFAAVAYWAKMASHVSGDQLDDAPYSLVLYTYGDYMITCPLLTLDLMWTLNLPYKFTYTLFVFLVLFSGFISSGHPDPGRWMWFAYGMTIFAFTWLRIVGLVQVRFLQYFAKKEKAPAGSQDNRRQSISAKAGFRQKEVRNPLQFALYVYFTIWMIYPLLWVLAAEGLISSVVNHCVTVMMDVLAKSMYGFALLEFQLRIDKSQVEFTQLKVTKAELQEEIMEEKKKIRKITKKQEEEEMSRRGNDYEDEDHWPAHLQSTRFAQGFTSPSSSTRPSPKPSPKPSPSMQQNSAFAVGQVPAMESYGNGNMMRSKPPMMGDGRSMNSANGIVNMMPVRSNSGADSPRRPSPMNDGRPKSWRDL